MVERGMARYESQKGWNAASDRKRARQDAFIAGIAEGKTLAELQAAVGVTHRSHEHWMTEPKYRARVRAARAQYQVGNDDARQRTTAMSFEVFRHRYFGMRTFTHQTQLVSMLDSVKPGEIALINLWPEAGKTATLEDWLSQQIAVHPGVRITDLSASDDLGSKTCGKLQSRMTDAEQFPEYIATFGPFLGEGDERTRRKTWSASRFRVAKAKNDERDYTFQARAVTSKAYGTRMDILLCDDVQSRADLNLTEKILSILRYTYFTRGTSMRIIIIGTRVGVGDVYEKLIDSGVIDHYIAIPAIQPDGTITCPEMWCRDAFGQLLSFPTEAEMLEHAQAAVTKKRALVGEEAWWCEYQQQPRSNLLATFTDEAIDLAKDHDRGIEPGQVGDYVALSLDPALGGGNALTASVLTSDELRVLDQRIDRDFARNEQIFTVIEDFARRYYPQLLIIEHDGMQKGIGNDERLRDLGRAYGFTIQGHRSSRQKHDPVSGVASMGGSFARGEVRIPWGDEHAQSRMDELVAQLRAWRPNVPTKVLTQDAVMSLWFVHKYWVENIREREGVGDVSAWQRRAVPYAPTPYRVLSA